MTSGLSPARELPKDVQAVRARGFVDALALHGRLPLRRDRVTTLQVNLGKLCNQACQHCHVAAGPGRTEVMDRRTAERVGELLERSPEVATVDLTGGAPELNPNFRWLVGRARDLGRHVIDRCNLTVLLEPGMDGLAAFLAEQGVELIASLPCYTAENVDRQRGRGVFAKSVRVLQELNRAGFGMPGSPLQLHLVYNPLGAFLPGPQSGLEVAYKEHLRGDFGVEFNRLLTMTNMPINRFSDWLRRQGTQEDYLSLLAASFNPSTVPHLMCRTQVSVGWNGELHDCDFNQMLEIGSRRPTIWQIESCAGLTGTIIATGSHCFACTAGAGSSCGGALQ